jgi:hypothetical protein
MSLGKHFNLRGMQRVRHLGHYYVITRFVTYIGHLLLSGNEIKEVTIGMYVTKERKQLLMGKPIQGNYVS